MSVFGKHCDFYWFILYVNAPCQAYFDTWLETWLVTESNLRLFFCLACVICSDSLDTTLLDYSSLSTFSVVSVYCICCDICEERKKKSNILERKTTRDTTGLPCWENVCVNAARVKCGQVHWIQQTVCVECLSVWYWIIAVIIPDIHWETCW